MVAAFEQSLSNMTQRLQQLSVTADRKDGELTDMRQTIELLRKQSIQAGLTSAHMNSMNEMPRSQQQHQQQQQQQHQQQHGQHLGGASIRPASGELRSIHDHPDGTSSGGGGDNGCNATAASDLIHRHLSSDSMCSLNSLSSGCSSAQQDKKKKKGWLRSSFNKAFTRNAGPKLTKSSRNLSSAPNSSAASQCTDDASQSAADVLPPLPPSASSSSHHHHHSHAHGVGKDAASAAASMAALPPLPQSPTKRRTLPSAATSNGIPVMHNHGQPELDTEGNPIVEDLKKQLREKDLVLTDIRLEALSSASQLESLKDTVSKMRQEMMNLKQNNERLQKMVTSRSLAGSECSLGLGNGGGGGGGVSGPISPSGSMGEPRRYSLADGSMRPVSLLFI